MPAKYFALTFFFFFVLVFGWAQATLADMTRATSAVRRALARGAAVAGRPAVPLLVADIPFVSSVGDTLRDAAQLVTSGADCVKVLGSPIR